MAIPIRLPTGELTGCIGVDPSNHLALIREIGEATNGWRKVRDNWSLLMQLYKKERKQESAPELYALMKKIGL